MRLPAFFLLVASAIAQPPPITINQTQVQGGIAADCLKVNSNRTLGQGTCGGGGGGALPAGSLGACQTYATSSTFGGDVAVCNLSLSNTFLGLTANLGSVAPASRTITGTTTANATASIVGVGTAFLTQVHVNDLLALSSDLSEVGTVTKVTDNTHLELDSGWWGDSLGDGTSQTITIWPAAQTWKDVNGGTFMALDSNGHMAWGANPEFGSGAATVGVTNPESTWFINSTLDSTNNIFVEAHLGSTDSGTFMQAYIADTSSSDGQIEIALYGVASGNSGHKTAKLNGQYGEVRVFDGGATVAASYWSNASVNTGTGNEVYGYYVAAPQLFAGGSISVRNAAFFNENMTGLAGAGKDFAWYSEGGTNHLETGKADSVGVEIERVSMQSADLLRILDSNGSTVLNTVADKDGYLYDIPITPMAKAPVCIDTTGKLYAGQNSGVGAPCP